MAGNDAVVLVGVGVSTRHVGVALVIAGRVAHFETLRRRSGGTERLRRVVINLAEIHGARAIAVTDAASSGASTAAAFCGACDAAGTEPVLLGRIELARLLALDKASNQALRDWLAERSMLVRSRVSAHRAGPRTERERYWDPAIAGACAALAFERLLQAGPTPAP